MQRVLACVDLSPISRRVFEWAVRLAQPQSAEVVLLHVAPGEPDFIGYDPGPGSVRQAVADHLREEHRALQQLATTAPDGVAVRPLMVQGIFADKILDHAQRLPADVIVIGSHGHGALYDLVVGSVANQLLKRSTLPVLVVPRSED